MVANNTLDKLLNISIKREKRPYVKVIQAKPHTPVYMMHKFWARRPYNVFSELIAHYSEPNNIVLDPFCGGGVTIVQALSLKRRAIGVDLNPLATYVTEMEVKPLHVNKFWNGYKQLQLKIEKELLELYRTSCPKCNSSSAIFDWLEWEGEKPTRMKYECMKCGIGEKQAGEEDLLLSKKIDEDFEKIVLKKRLWYPRFMIPKGDKTEGIMKSGCTHFSQLFTRRNLLALSTLYKEISDVKDETNVKEFLQFSFSSSLKWASKQSHLRGNIVEGWAMHAYWLYPKTLEINVWNTFSRRCKAIARGKEYSNRKIGAFFKKAESFEDLVNEKATCLILTQSSANLPMSNEKVDL